MSDEHMGECQYCGEEVALTEAEECEACGVGICPLCMLGNFCPDCEGELEC